jgi:transposase
MEATGYARWFERPLTELGIELWIGDAAKIKTKRVRTQKTDRNDAPRLLHLLLDNNFPRSGYRAQRFVIYDNCRGTGIGWCRCARGS